MVNIALYKPDIPQNTAAIIRLAACLGLKVHIIEPCGFNLEDPRFKRVVMDYMNINNISFYKDYKEFFKIKKKDRVILITTKADKVYTDFSFKKNDTILFGRESSGVPKHVHEIVNERLRIPMLENKRSLNLATSVGIVLAEQLRQN